MRADRWQGDISTASGRENLLTNSLATKQKSPQPLEPKAKRPAKDLAPSLDE
ncbi:hypothetical protein KH388_22175 [Serratia rubidaea]|nr:hypothetical protein [Serratia rubidaea]